MANCPTAWLTAPRASAASRWGEEGVELGQGGVQYILAWQQLYVHPGHQAAAGYAPAAAGSSAAVMPAIWRRLYTLARCC